METVNTHNKKKITEDEVIDFFINYYQNANYTYLRMGQAFCNQFNISDPLLFKETNVNKCRNIIKTKYIHKYSLIGKVKKLLNQITLRSSNVTTTGDPYIT